GGDFDPGLSALSCGETEVVFCPVALRLPGLQNLPGALRLSRHRHVNTFQNCIRLIWRCR
ncbi:hypothetical protein QYE88_42355, partial [Enterobacter hormaechei subsp. steigerwaltii]|nr:hypothetical protein [Enterobacter hormaechei subsp. steigerwaltii]